MTLPVSTGELAGLLCAVLWAVNGMLLRTQADRIPPASMSVVRCAVAALLFWCLLPFDRPSVELLEVPWSEWGLLLASVSAGIGVGDTLYLIAIKEIGLSLTMALSGVFPLTTIAWEALLLGHPPGWELAAGSCLVVLGVVLLSRPTGAPLAPGGRPVRLRFGVVLSLFAAIFWGLASVLLKPAIAHFSLVQANATRMTMVAVLLYLLRVLPSERHGLRAYDRRAFFVVATTGVLGMGAGAWLFLYAMSHAGVATAVTLSSSAPLFGVLFGTVFLKERLTLPMGLGMACCLLGVWVVL